MYLLDAAYIFYVHNVTTVYFDTPINYSDNGYHQHVYIVKTYNTFIIRNENESVVAANVSNGTLIYFIARIDLCRKPPKLIEVWNSTPQKASDSLSLTYPHNLTPYISKLLREFSSWLYRTYGIDANSSPRGLIAYYLALYIYTTYVRYAPSPYPRPLIEIIEKREGDCDDMSRLLAAALRFMGVPAKIEHVYVYIPGFNISIPLESNTINFVNCGPHAYVLAYLGNNVGWVPLDLIGAANFRDPVLGSSRYSPWLWAVVLGHSYAIDIPQQIVKEVKEFNRKVHYHEIVILQGRPFSTEEIRRIERMLTSSSNTTTSRSQIVTHTNIHQSNTKSLASSTLHQQSRSRITINMSSTINTHMSTCTRVALNTIQLTIPLVFACVCVVLVLALFRSRR